MTFPLDSLIKKKKLDKVVNIRFDFSNIEYTIGSFNGNRNETDEIPLVLLNDIVILSKGKRNQEGFKTLSYKIGLDSKQNIGAGIAMNTNFEQSLSKNISEFHLTVNDSNLFVPIGNCLYTQHLRTISTLKSNFLSQKNLEKKEFEFNSEFYNVIHLAENPAKDKFIFSSNMPNSFGGYDLYFVEKKEGIFSKPIHLGPHINSEKDELFPSFINNTRIVFSSNGRNNKSDFDFYTYSLLEKTNEAEPIHAINTTYNEIALVADPSFSFGAFASDKPLNDPSYRDYNIFNFRKEIIDAKSKYEYFKDSVDMTLEKTNSCVQLDLSNSIDKNGLSYEYLWEMGDGGTAQGEKIEYCYTQPGKYIVKLICIAQSPVKIKEECNSVQIDILPSLMLEINSKDTLTVDEIFEGIIKHNWHEKDFVIKNIFWKTDESQFYSGNILFGKFNSSGWHKLEAILETEIKGKRKIKYLSKKIFIRK
ncbi:MAG: hypothetical protein EAZ07_05425 [Cytophagales bacterium]|nr:MAG: hypothetical protein EAZ07_05425 [Cytophagales bacterium]